MTYKIFNRMAVQNWAGAHSLGPAATATSPSPGLVCWHRWNISLLMQLLGSLATQNFRCLLPVPQRLERTGCCKAKRVSCLGLFPRWRAKIKGTAHLEWGDKATPPARVRIPRVQKEEISPSGLSRSADGKEQPVDGTGSPPGRLSHLPTISQPQSWQE